MVSYRSYSGAALTVKQTEARIDLASGASVTEICPGWRRLAELAAAGTPILIDISF
ncbi:hypothetical protein GCM10011488_01180 [Steroidobacter agaridevorans]|nr:hypothetical protein GCM10011488_01180 [Steroidobacter agaridevorans]